MGVFFAGRLRGRALAGNGVTGLQGGWVGGGAGREGGGRTCSGVGRARCVVMLGAVVDGRRAKRDRGGVAALRDEGAGGGGRRRQLAGGERLAGGRARLQARVVGVVRRRRRALARLDGRRRRQVAVARHAGCSESNAHAVRTWHGRATTSVTGADGRTDGRTTGLGTRPTFLAARCSRPMTTSGSRVFVSLRYVTERDRIR